MSEPEERYTDRTAIIGKTGTGKSVLARYKFQRIRTQKILIDVKGMESLPGVDPVRTVSGLDWTRPVLHFVPKDPADQDEIDRLYAAILWQAREHRRPIAVWLDESYGPTTSNQTPKHVGVVLMQGRALGIRHQALMQRPVRVSKALISEAEHIIIFPKGLAVQDRKLLADELGLTMAEWDRLVSIVTDAEQFGDYGHFHYEIRRQLLHMRPSVAPPGR